MLKTFNNPTPVFFDNFGISVSISGNNVLVGAQGDDTGANSAGSAYLFDVINCDDDTSNGGTSGDGICEAATRTFNNPTPLPGDFFGNSVSISGNNVLVGAIGDNTGANNAGSAYLFDATTGDSKTFNNPTPGPGDSGNSVSISGNNVLVGAIGDDTVARGAGSAYLFDATTYRLLETFNNPTPEFIDFFGNSVSISKNNVLIGGPLDNTGATSAGSAYLFDLTDMTPPTVTVPADFTAEASSPSGASVSYSVSASDNIDGPITPTCTPASGSTFPLGMITVECTATDAAFNTGSDSFIVSVIAEEVDNDNDGIFNLIDNLPDEFSNDFSDVPLGGTTVGTITDRGNQILTIAEEPNPEGVKITADPAGGSTSATIALCGGTTDAHPTAGNQYCYTCNTVSIQVIFGPVDFTFFGDDGSEATSSIIDGNGLTFDPQILTFSAPITNPDIIDVVVNGEEFPISPGEMFISDPAESAQDVIDELNDLLTDPGSSPDLVDKIEDVRNKVQTALDELNKMPPDNQAVAGNIEGAVGDLEATIKDGLLESTEGEELINQLLDLVRVLAADAIDVANNTPGSDADKIAEANTAFTDGDNLRASGDFKDAAAQYKDAIASAEGALP